MNVKTVPMSDLFDRCNDIYTTVLITAKRSRQIIDQRFVPIDENEDVEESIDLIEPEIIVENLDKPMVIALQEHLNGELEWRKPSEDVQSKDES